MREKWAVVGSYHDAAISGSGMTLRPGIQAFLRDAQAGAFDVVLAEALDRISRDQAAPGVTRPFVDMCHVEPAF